VPNKRLRHIKLANNQGKPVVSSRDTQEVPTREGQAVHRILHTFEYQSSLLDEFDHFDRAEVDIKKQHQVATAAAAAAAAVAAVSNASSSSSSTNNATPDAAPPAATTTATTTSVTATPTSVATTSSSNGAAAKRPSNAKTSGSGSGKVEHKSK
jgi:hypothetical protein